ncbi:MAG: hypothetical protein HYW24_00795 [Candidatus Aenigmarchaeota archaeon]|nr:hypothetical protein [Candidatus Aenigmarchaeota archaeon]
MAEEEIKSEEVPVESIVADPPKEENKPKKTAQKMDSQFRRDLAFLQKKIADLEIAISDIQEGAKKVDMDDFEGVKQRVDDMEDLVMVENAGIIELKKMLEGMQAGSQLVPAVEELKGRLNALEEKISNTQPDTANIDEIKNSFESLKTEIDAKLSEIRTSAPNVENVNDEMRAELNKSVDWMKNEVTSLVEQRTTSIEKQLADVNQKVSSLPSPEELNGVVEGMTNSFKSFKGSLETRFQTEQNKLEQRWASVEDKVMSSSDLLKTMEEFKADLDMKRRALEVTIDSIEEKLRLPMHERAVRELEKIRNDWIINNSRVDSLETIVKSFSSQIETLRPSMKKMETFDKILDLHTEITRKHEEMKRLHDSAERIAGRLESVDIEKETRKFEEKIKNISKDIEYATRLPEKLESDMKIMQEDMSVLQGNLMALEQKSTNFDNFADDLRKTRMNTEKRLRENEEMSGVMKNDLDGIKNSLKKQQKGDMTEVVKKIEGLEADIQGVKSLIPEKSEDKSELELAVTVQELQRKIERMEATSFSDQISELINRLVFVESRIVALEVMIQNMPRYSPIIVE